MKTERMRKTIISALIIRKMARPRRIVIVVGAALSRVFVPRSGYYYVVRGRKGYRGFRFEGRVVGVVNGREW